MELVHCNSVFEKHVDQILVLCSSIPGRSDNSFSTICWKFSVSTAFYSILNLSRIGSQVGIKIK